MLAENLGDEPRDMGSGEAVSRRRTVLSASPWHAHIDAVRAEFHRWFGVVVERVWIRNIMRGNGNHRREQRRKACDRTVVRRRDEYDVLEVRSVGQLMER